MSVMIPVYRFLTKLTVIKKRVPFCFYLIENDGNILELPNLVKF